MKNHVVTIIFLILSFNLYGQTNFFQSKQAYLGLRPPGEKPEVFAKGLLTDSGFAIGRVAFSNDGQTFFYSYAKHWYSGQGNGTSAITFDGQQWSKPTVIAENLTLPTLSIDGKSLFLLGNGGVIWETEKEGAIWSTPKQYLKLSYDLYNFMPTISGNYYVGSNGTWGKMNDYSTYKFSLLRINGDDTTIKSLGTPLNKPGFNGDFYIAPDESYIIISTNESPDYESELYISFRKKDASWTKPISLGENINRGKAHRFGQYVSPDGKYLFYTSGTAEKDTQIYWLRFDKLLKNLKEQSQIEQ